MLVFRGKRNFQKQQQQNPKPNENKQMGSNESQCILDKEMPWPKLVLSVCDLFYTRRTIPVFAFPQRKEK